MRRKNHYKTSALRNFAKVTEMFKLKMFLLKYLINSNAALSYRFLKQTSTMTKSRFQSTNPCNEFQHTKIMTNWKYGLKALLHKVLHVKQITFCIILLLKSIRHTLQIFFSLFSLFLLFQCEVLLFLYCCMWWSDGFKCMNVSF